MAIDLSMIADDKRTFLRRIVLGIGLCVVAIVAVQWFINYSTTGTLVASTNDPAAKILVSTQADEKLLFQGVGDVKRHVHTGTYVLTASSRYGATSRVVIIKPHSTNTTKLTLVALTQIEPVSDSTAQATASNNDRLYFLNSDGNLCQISSDNTQRVIESSVTFRDIKWANSNFGLGASSTGALYIIVNGVVRALPKINLGEDSQSLVYAVAPNQKMYAAFGRTVYTISETGVYKQIFVAADDPTSLIAGNDEVVVATNPDNGGLTSSKSGAHPSITVVPASGAPITKNVGSFIDAMSPDESYIAISGPKGGEILNRNLQTISTLPSSGFTNPFWLNDKTLIYSTRDQLWSYDVRAESAKLLAYAPKQGVITSIAVNDDRSYLYLGVQTLGSPVIKRVSLQNQEVSPLLVALQAIMPYSADNYHLMLINFSSPTVYVQPNYPLTDTDAEYVSAATNQLQKLAIDTTKIQLRLSR